MSNHAHLITPAKGVWLLRPEVFILILSKDRNLGRKEGADHNHSNTILYLKDPRSQPSVDWPLEVHQKSTSNPTKTTQLSQSTQLHHDCSTTPPTQELTSFPVWAEQHHLLTIVQSHPLHTFAAFPPVLQSTQSHWCRLPH